MLGSYLATTIPYIQERRAETEALRDSILDSLIVKLGGKYVANAITNGRTADNIHSCSGTTSTITAQITNFVPVVNSLVKTQWDEYAPYNNNYYQSNCGFQGGSCGSPNGKYSVGCVPTAISQVIAYFNAKKSVDWQRIANTANTGDGDIATMGYFDS